MKKLALLLALVLVLSLSLTACGQEERYPDIADLLDAGKFDAAIEKIEAMKPTEKPTDAPTDPTDPPTDPEPTMGPELERLQSRFFSSVDRLNPYYNGDYSFDGLTVNYHDGEVNHSFKTNEAAAWVYESAQALAPWDSAAQEVLDRFTLLEDQLLSLRVWHEDGLGNIKEDDDIHLSYRSNGEPLYLPKARVQSYYGPKSGYRECGGKTEYTYDEAGRTVKLRYFDKEEILSIIEYTYDDAGRLTLESYRDAHGYDFNIVHHYDEEGRLVRREGAPYYGNGGGANITMDEEYTYDDLGRLIQVVGTRNNTNDYDYSTTKIVMEYDYDAQGNVTELRWYNPTYEQDGNLYTYWNVYVWNYEYDEAGRVICHEFTDYGHVDANGVPRSTTPPVTYVVEYTYGTFYAYTPAG